MLRLCVAYIGNVLYLIMVLSDEDSIRDYQSPHITEYHSILRAIKLQTSEYSRKTHPLQIDQCKKIFRQVSTNSIASPTTLTNSPAASIFIKFNSTK